MKTRAEAVEYAYRMRGTSPVDGQDRKGQKCAMLNSRNGRSHIRFEDGSEAIVNRILVRRLPESAIDAAAPQ